jgi:hypothetical protein
MIVKIVVPDSIYANVYFARGEQGPQGVTGNTGPQGPSGIVNVDSPITNSGTTTAANIGLNQALIQIAPAQVTGTAVVTADSRLSDQRVPTDGSVTDTKIVAGGLSPNRVTGTAVITTDSRLSDARTPLAHAATHGSAGSDPVTLAQSQITNLVSDLSAKAPIDSPVFTTKVTLPVTSGTFLGTNSLGEIYKVGASPGLGYLPYTASVGGGIAWQNLATLVKTDAANTFSVGGHIINNNAVGTVPLQVNGVSGQTADLIQVRDNAGNNNLSVSPTYGLVGRNAGTVSFALSSAGGLGAFYLQNASQVGLLVRGATSQTANLQEWQISTGGTVARVTSSGSLVTTQGFAVLGGASISGSIATLLQTSNAARIALVVQGAASQSANLQEWQNSAGGTVARVNNLGEFFAPIIWTTNAYAGFTEQSAGGALRMTKLTAAGSNPGAGNGRIYFRDGTNAGTLKLVVRAGAAGAETTILDNIPQ